MYTKLTSFDGTESYSCCIEKPAKYSELFNILKNSKFIPRGAGLSYCMASGGNNVTSIDTSFFNRIISFNKEIGTITVEPGINLGNLLEVITREGWFLPVLPGYPKITVGGCIAFNVHGKSQYRIGLFGDYVNKLKIFHPAYGEIVCSNNENSDIFELTKGGFGLTGLITEVELRLTPLKNKYVRLKKIFVSNLKEAIEFMAIHKDEYDNIYSWNNLNNKRRSFGSGVVYVEKFLDYNYTQPESNTRNGNMTWDNRASLRIGFYNKLTTVLECKMYHLKENLDKKELILPIEKASFPIKGKEIYFKLYGNKGLREYQMIIPKNKWVDFENQFYNLIQLNEMKFTLGSLKLFEGEPSLLNFQKSGVCLALDVPANNSSYEFFNKLDNLVIQNEGIANLSKDSRLEPTVLEKMYPGYNKFKDRLKFIEKNEPLNSALRSRLKL
jgi:decaprenylphospho-beta-D-ribofuranose 2-oxidase